MNIDSEEPSTIRTGFLEASNVQVVEEMVKLITPRELMNLTQKPLPPQTKCFRQQIILEDKV